MEQDLCSDPLRGETQIRGDLQYEWLDRSVSLFRTSRTAVISRKQFVSAMFGGPGPHIRSVDSIQAGAVCSKIW